MHAKPITALLALAALAGCELEPVEETRAEPMELTVEAKPMSAPDGARMLIIVPARETARRAGALPLHLVLGRYHPHGQESNLVRRTATWSRRAIAA